MLGKTIFISQPAFDTNFTPISQVSIEAHFVDLRIFTLHSPQVGENVIIT